MNASDVLVERLVAWGVDTIFGLPGDGINGVMESLRKAQDKIRFIHVRHEESAAFNDVTGTFQQQDVELDKLFIDVACYNNRVMSGAHMESVVDLAIRSAIEKRAVSHITIPIDVQQQPAKAEKSQRNIAHHSSSARAITGNVPPTEDLQSAASILNEGKKIAILAGQGALEATDELLELAELLGAPIIKPLLGKGCVPDDSPYTTGGIGLLGTAPSEEALEDCDTLLMVGTSYPYIEYLPKPGDCRCIQIDSNAQRIGLRTPVEVGLVGDSKKTLQLLLPLLRRNDHRRFLEKAQKSMKAWSEVLEKEGTATDMPMKPQVVGWELSKRTHQNAIIVSDSGTNTTVWARYMQAKRGQMHSCSGNLATMACGLPYAIAAQVAYPGRQVIGIVGDGGFTMLMGEIITAVAYKLPIKIVIIKNNTLGQIKWEQMVFQGNPEYQCELFPIDFVALAQAVGANGVRIDDPRTAGAKLDEALAIPGPVLIEAVVDQFTALLPAKITADQAIKFSKSLAKGQPDRLKIALTAAKDTVRQVV